MIIEDSEPWFVIPGLSLRKRHFTLLAHDNMGPLQFHAHTENESETLLNGDYRFVFELFIDRVNN